MREFFAFRRYLRRCKALFILGLLAGFFAALASGAGVPYFIKIVFAEVFESTDSQYSAWEIFLVAAQLPGVFLVRGFSGYFNQYWMNYCGLRVLEGIRRDLFSKIQFLPLAYHDRNKSGDLLSRILSDTTLLQFTLQESANDLFRQPMQVVFAFATLIFLSLQEKDAAIVLLICAGGPMAMIPVFFIGRRLKIRGLQMQEAQAEMTQCLNENLEGATEIRTFNLQDQQISFFGALLGKLFRSQMKVVKYERLTQPLIEFLSAALVAFSFVYCYLKGVPFSTFMALGGVLFMTYDPLKRIFRVYGNIQKCQGAINRVNDILHETDSIRDAENPKPAPRGKSSILFDKVSFAYTEAPVLHGVEVEIPAGQVVALVGPSGAGKSTFAKLIPRLYEVSSGSIRINGTDIRDFSKWDLRDHIAIVSQHPVLFNDTLFNNIRLGRENASEEDVYLAARNAFAHSFISELEEGYQTLAGERGDRLSGGQKQRIAIARAFLRNSPILILDEATSALDAQSEEEIQRALNSLVIGKTVIIIAHRFSTIRLADRIFVFDKGKLIANGAHGELYNRSPLYTELYDKQL